MVRTVFKTYGVMMALVGFNPMLVLAGAREAAVEEQIRSATARKGIHLDEINYDEETQTTTVVAEGLVVVVDHAAQTFEAATDDELYTGSLNADYNTKRQQLSAFIEIRDSSEKIVGAYSGTAELAEGGNIDLVLMDSQQKFLAGYDAASQMVEFKPTERGMARADSKQDAKPQSQDTKPAASAHPERTAMGWLGAIVGIMFLVLVAVAVYYVAAYIHDTAIASGLNRQI